CLALAEIYARGRGVPASEARAAEWMAHACAAGAGERARCLDAGRALAARRSTRQARAILAPLCTAGEALACSALAPLARARDREPLYRRACELGDEAACAHAPGATPRAAEL